MKCYILLMLVTGLTEATLFFPRLDEQQHVRRYKAPSLIKRNPMISKSDPRAGSKSGKASNQRSNVHEAVYPSYAAAARSGSPLRAQGPSKSSKNDATHEAVITANVKGPSSASVVYGNNVLRPVIYKARAGQTKSWEFKDPKKVMMQIENKPGGRALHTGTARKGNTAGRPDMRIGAESASEAHSNAGTYQYSEASKGQVSRAKAFSGDSDGHVLLRGALHGPGTTEMTVSNSPPRARERQSE